MSMFSNRKVRSGFMALNIGSFFSKVAEKISDNMKQQVLTLDSLNKSGTPQIDSVPDPSTVGLAGLLTNKKKKKKNGDGTGFGRLDTIVTGNQGIQNQAAVMRKTLIGVFDTNNTGPRRNTLLGV